MRVPEMASFEAYPKYVEEQIACCHNASGPYIITEAILSELNILLEIPAETAASRSHLAQINALLPLP